MNFDVRDLDRTKRTFTIRGHARDFLNQLDGVVIALSKDGIAAVEAGVGNFSDEELRAVGVGPCIRVGEAAGAIKGDFRRSLILELVAGVARAVTFGVATLNHKCRNRAVKDGAVIKRDTVFFDMANGGRPIFAAISEADEIGDGLGRLLLVELAGDAAH